MFNILAYTWFNEKIDEPAIGIEYKATNVTQ